MNIQEKINNYLILEAKKKREERDVTDDYTFYPSSAGQCIRKMWNERKHPVDFSPETYRRFLVGNLVHEWMQAKIFPSGSSETPVRWSHGDEINFRGRVDCIIEDVVYEFKTIQDLTYVKNKPKPEHVEQINMYLHALNLEHGVIVYITKNTLDIIEHPITYDQDLYLETVKVFKRLSKYLVENREPKPAKCISPWSCEYCRNDPDRKKGIAIAKAIKAKKERMKTQKVLPDTI